MSVNNLTNIINSNHENRQQNLLTEPSVGMSLPIESAGCIFKSYSFDKNVAGNVLLPFLRSVTGVQSMCDYILFCEQAGKLFVLLVELKRGKNQTMPQLEAGKCFAKFLIETENRVSKTDMRPEYRLIAVGRRHFVSKGPTKMKGVKYNSSGFYSFEGNTFRLRALLK